MGAVNISGYTFSTCSTYESPAMRIADTHSTVTIQLTTRPRPDDLYTQKVFTISNSDYSYLRPMVTSDSLVRYEGYVSSQSTSGYSGSTSVTSTTATSALVSASLQASVTYSASKTYNSSKSSTSGYTGVSSSRYDYTGSGAINSRTTISNSSTASFSDVYNVSRNFIQKLVYLSNLGGASYVSNNITYSRTSSISRVTTYRIGTTSNLNNRTAQLVDSYNQSYYRTSLVDNNNAVIINCFGSGNASSRGEFEFPSAFKNAYVNNTRYFNYMYNKPVWEQGWGFCTTDYVQRINNQRNYFYWEQTSSTRTFSSIKNNVTMSFSVLNTGSGREIQAWWVATKAEDLKYLKLYHFCAGNQTTAFEGGNVNVITKTDGTIRTEMQIELATNGASFFVPLFYVTNTSSYIYLQYIACVTNSINGVTAKGTVQRTANWFTCYNSKSATSYYTNNTFVTTLASTTSSSSSSSYLSSSTAIGNLSSITALTRSSSSGVTFTNSASGSTSLSKTYELASSYYSNNNSSDYNVSTVTTALTSVSTVNAMTSFPSGASSTAKTVKTSDYNNNFYRNTNFKYYTNTNYSASSVTNDNGAYTNGNMSSTTALTQASYYSTTSSTIGSMSSTTSIGSTIRV